MMKTCEWSPKDNLLYHTSACLTGPVLVSYVLWVLNSAARDGIQRLYFLARDGYILLKIAKLLIEEYSIPIECRYFYCSRYSLRMPLFLINHEEALDKYCITGYQVTPDVVLGRAGFSDSERERMFSILKIRDSKAVLSEYGLNRLRDKLANCPEFIRIVTEKSKRAFELVHGYFEQEGCFDGTPYAVVDSGWLGSMQRSIRQITEYSGCPCKPQGYYFGMFENGKSEDGIYRCYFFSKDNHYFRCVNFNNNLFECLCSAEHGMTIGYQKQDDGNIVPLMKPYHAAWNLALQNEAIVDYTRLFTKSNQKVLPVLHDSDKMVFNLLKSFMAAPSREEAELYGGIPFCDDLTEQYMRCLSERLSLEDLKQQMVIPKVTRKLFDKKNEKKFQESFWVQGTLSRFPYPHMKLLRFRIQLSGFVKYLRLYNRE
jgi:hypothetical protein